jgi:hypothetical protein
VKVEEKDVTGAEVTVLTTVANEWEVLTFDLTQSETDPFSTSNSYKSLVLFADLNSKGLGEIFYVDDIIVTN